MLKRITFLAFPLVYLLAVGLCGALSLLLASEIIAEGAVPRSRDLLYDVQVSILLSFSFIVVSGFIISVPVMYYTYGHRKNWHLRAVANSILFVIHFSIFYYLVGSSFLFKDILILILGVCSVAAADAILDLLFGRAVQNQHL